MIDYSPLRPYIERYAGLPVGPLRIMLYLKPNSRLAGYDLLNLDNLLARCVVDEATEGAGLPPRHDDGYILPVPLHCLWRDPCGYPLWAATPFTPDGLAIQDTCYWHKRAQRGEWTGTRRGTFAITSTKGRWMERRVPLPTAVAEHWQASCIGNAEEIARLLTPLSHVGKRRSIGFGEIARWTITPLAEPWGLVSDGRLTRPLPGLAVGLLGGLLPEGSPAPVGWTPPEWKPSLFAPGWWTGTPVGTPGLAEGAHGPEEGWYAGCI